MKKITSFKNIFMLIFAFIICFGTQAQVYDGDLYLYSQTDVNAFNYKEVTGALVINGGFGTIPFITDLTPLSSLTTVGKTLMIHTTFLFSLSGLENLTSVGSISICENLFLETLTPLSSINSGVRSLTLEDNIRLTDFSGLENITDVLFWILIRNNTALTSLSGLENITSVGTNVVIHNNAALTSFCDLYGLINGGGLPGTLNVLDNAVNPTKQEILDDGPCNSPPVAICQDVIISADENCQANVTAADIDNGSIDPDGDALSLSIYREGPYEIGVTNVTLTVNDGRGGIAKCVTSITVVDDMPPLITCPADVTLECPADISIAATGSATAIDACDQDVTITSSDVSLPGCGNTGVITRTWIATDESGNSASCEQTITVADNTPPVFKGEPINVTVECDAIFDPATVKAIDNCDPNPEITLVETSIPGSCAQEYTLVRTWTATDLCGNSASISQTINVVDNTPPVLTIPHDVTLECPADISVAATGVATATDNCGEASLEYLDERVVGCGNTETISRTWTATDDCGNATSAVQTIVVVDELPPIISGVPAEIVQKNDPGVCGAIVTFPAISADDNCQADVVLSFEPASGSFFPIGNTLVTATAADACGNSASASFEVTIENQPPVLSNLMVPIDPVEVGTPVSVSLNFEDDNLTEATIDWGDGNQSVASIDQGIITGEYTYAEPGVNILTINVNDACGESASLIHRYIVVYDPSAGFVTGGGWIFSPEGAYTPDPLLTGKASFGFVAKYKKGSTVPDGNTEFQFKAGNLNFKSIDYDWLVIAGSKAMFKGNGTINGFGNYGFMLSAIDADLTPSTDVDKFRIRIWDKEDDIMVYDNNLAFDDNADPTTEIGGGSIIIHTGKHKSAQFEPDISTVTENAKYLVYPNPFIESLKFEFVSPENVYAIIDIFDVTGRKVKTVFNGYIEGNVYYNAEFVPVSELSNIYFYQIKLGEEVFYGKVVYNRR